MKKTLLTTLMVALAFFAFSQSNKEEVDLGTVCLWHGKESHGSGIY